MLGILAPAAVEDSWVEALVVIITRFWINEK